MLKGQTRIEADRMWRAPEWRKRFEAETGITDEATAQYQYGFIGWALAQLAIPDAAQSSSEPAGTSACPICGKDTPHNHPAWERNPAAWLCEIAHLVTQTDQGNVWSDWRPSLTFHVPNVPKGSIRNLRPLHHGEPSPQSAMAFAVDRLTRASLQPATPAGGDEEDDLPPGAEHPDNYRKAFQRASKGTTGSEMLAGCGTPGCTDLNCEYGKEDDAAAAAARSSAGIEDAMEVTDSDRDFAVQIIDDFDCFEEGITDQEKLAQWVRNIRRGAVAQAAPMRRALETIARTTFSGSEMDEAYMRGNRDAHATCASIARGGLAQAAPTASGRDPVAPEQGWLQPALDKAEKRAAEMPDWMRRTASGGDAAAAKPRPGDCLDAMNCSWHHVPTVPEIGLHLCGRFGCPHTTSAASSLPSTQDQTP